MGDHVCLRGPRGEARPLVSLSKNFPPRMDLGLRCELTDFVSLHLRDVRVVLGFFMSWRTRTEK